MYARVATFEGGDPEQVRQMLAQIEQQSGPPEGVPAKGLLVLHKAEDGNKVLAITMFDTEEDMRQGDAVFNSMEPPTPGGMGRRMSVELFEAPLKRDL